MKFKLFSLSLTALFCCIPALAVFAQSDMSKSQLVAVHEDVVIPSMVDKYEQAAKNLASLFAKHNIASMSYTCASTQDFTYLYLTPVSNLAEVETFGAAFDELQKKMGAEAFKADMKQFDGCYDSHRNYLVRLHPDLSYKPEYGNQISEEMNFRHWDFYYIHPEKEQEAMAIAKEWKALYESKKIATGYRLYTGDLGMDTPIIAVAQSAKNAVEFYTKSEEIFKTFGEAEPALLKKTWSVVRKFEHKDGSIRPDLS
jgi:hypothetical protein